MKKVKLRAKLKTAYANPDSEESKRFLRDRHRELVRQVRKQERERRRELAVEA